MQGAGRIAQEAKTRTGNPSTNPGHRTKSAGPIKTIIFAMNTKSSEKSRLMTLRHPFLATSDIFRFSDKSSSQRSPSMLAVILVAGLVSSVNLDASQWTRSQFSNLDPILFKNWNSSAPPGIPGLTFSPYPAEVSELAPSSYTNAGLARIALENTSGPGGYSYLDITFNPPQQAVGGFPFSLDGANISSVTEIVYDQNTNVIESASVSVPQFPGTPVFLGIGETTTNIYKVEWRYLNAGFFGVANIMYQPGPQIVLSNMPSSPNNISFQFQPLPGHTNMIQISTNLAAANWSTLSNLTFVGVGALTQMTIPMTNGPSGFFRVMAQ